MTRKSAFESLEPRWALAANVVINEFLALNSRGIVDQDNDHSDWIELKNTTAAPVNVGGWYLTNDASNPTKWQLPSVSIVAGGYLTIFASGKDRHVAGQELHTNFTLDDAGGYLALETSSLTIASSFAPYPAQLADVSYGLGPAPVTDDFLVDEEAPVRALVPTTSSVDATWRAVSFNDLSWLAGTSGVGYDDAVTDDYGPFINTDIGSQMKKTSGTGPGYAAYLRLPFSLADKDQLTSLRLQIRYDDGFVAYLNGVEVARRNFTGTLAYTSAASATHADSQAQLYESIDITPFVGTLANGANVLAIAGLNQSGDTTDFLIDPLLDATRVGPAPAGFMATPTPGTANNTTSLATVADTKFSVDRGFYSAPLDVQITTATPGAQIRYTLDGSVPTATTGLIYSAPIHITTTTNLRAAAFKTGYTPSDADAQTYVFLADVIHQTGAGLPSYATWGQAGPDWEMDPDIVNNPTYSSQIIDAMKAIPTMSISLPWADMFGAGGQGIYISGSGVPKAASTEYFTADGSQQFQINDSIQIQGGTSDDRWKQDKLSFRLKFTADFGPTKLDFPLFTDPTFDQGATQSFNTLVLDAESNNVWTHPDATQRSRDTHVVDQFVADLQDLSGGYSPHGTYVHLYINGLYWGVYYVHERPDDAFASEYLGDNKDNYDILKHNASTPVNSSTTAVPDYATLLTAVRQNMAVSANYQAVTKLLDVKNFIDYMIINYYVGNTDWASSTAQHNWYVSYDRISGTGKWRFHNWDAEHSLENLFDNVTAKLQTGGPTEIMQKLMVNSEFKLQFADEVQRLMFNGGLLTPQSAGTIFSQRAGELNLAIIGESARWGDNRSPTAPYTADMRNANVQNLLTNYFPQRTSVVLNQFIANGWFPALAAPTFSQYGGTIDPPFQLTLTGTAGATIYYTLDGSDPRLTGGAINTGHAQAYSGAITINAATNVKARARDGSGNWSPVIDVVFLFTTPDPVRIVEMNYHPADHAGVADAEDMEFIELLNTSNQAVDLNGLKIDRGITYQFTSSLMLGAGQRIVIARNRTVFQSIYGAGVNLAPGNYTGKLDNAGEEVRLVGPLGEVLQDFTYSDDDPWPGRADGKGSSLEIINPLGDPTDPSNWRSSYEFAGTPGTAGIGPQNRVVVNEVLTHTDLPQVDAIELYNTTSGSIDISGWYLSDSSDNYKKYKIPAGTSIGPGQYLVFDESAFNPATPIGGNVSFSLSSEGDDVWLVSPDASGNPQGFEQHVQFGAAINGESFGRWPNGTGELYPMSSVTLGSANSGPRIGPVAITEVMYNSTGGNPDLEFVELTNLTNQSISLSTTYPTVGAVPWKIDGLGFNFPLGTIVGPNGTLVVVHFDPANPANAGLLSAFRTAYGIGPEVPLVGGYTSLLDNSGERLQLLRPDAPAPETPTVVPYVLIDEVDYGVAAPWPTSPNQQNGQSLTRLLSVVYGDEATNWIGAAATPGTADLFPPAVTKVFVNGTGWSQSYRDYLQSLGLGSSQFGYAIPTGSDQSIALSWGNLNQVSIQFSENVAVHQADLSLFGADTSLFYNPSGFNYDSASHTATWSFASPIPADQLQLHLTSSAITDPATHALDGEWTNGVTSGSSGNGFSGGDFNFNFNVSAVVPTVSRGDFNFDGATDANDIAPFMNALTNLPGFQSAHSLSNIDLTFIADINGDHVVSNRDIQSMLDLAASAGSGDGSGANESESSMELAVTLPVNFVFSIVLPSMMPSPSTAAAVTDPVTAAASNPAKPTLFLPRGLTNLPSESGRKPMPNSQTSSLTADSPAPHPSKQLVAVVDRALSEWSMFRSWHLHWQNEKSPVDSTDDLLAEWK